MRLREHKSRLAFVLVAMTVCALLFVGAEAASLLRFARHEILAGQVWRMLTAHFVHANFLHGLLNLTAFGIIMHSFGHKLGLWQWLVCGALCCLVISVALLLFSPSVLGYAGLSGVLHGLFALGAVMCFFADSRLYGVALAALVVKLVHEQLPGFDVHYMAEVTGGAVIVDAHLYGSVAGSLIGAFYSGWRLLTNLGNL